MKLQEKADKGRELLRELNEVAKDLEGEGCVIEFQCNKPFNKIDFMLINRTEKL